MKRFVSMKKAVRQEAAWKTTSRGRPVTVAEVCEGMKWTIIRLLRSEERITPGGSPVEVQI